MTEQEQINAGLVLKGLDGANPLAFLAALGTLRGLTLAWPKRRVRLSWASLDAWRPCLHVGGDTPTEEETLAGLERFMEMRPGHQALEIGDNLTIPADEFRIQALNSAGAASPEDRAGADFIAAFGCDAVADRQGRIQDTALRTLSGAGHQHFLRTMRELAERTAGDNLRRCLFAPWDRPDTLYSLRWDPEDDRRYAHRWRDPSKETAGTEWGANRLAFEALPLFPVAPAAGSARTTGFSGTRSSDTFWTWPVWEPAADLDTVRSLLALQKLQDGALANNEWAAVSPPQGQRRSRPETGSIRGELAAMGVREVFRSQRITIGQYRGFTPSKPV